MPLELSAMTRIRAPLEVCSVSETSPLADTRRTRDDDATGPHETSLGRLARRPGSEVDDGRQRLAPAHDETSDAGRTSSWPYGSASGPVTAHGTPASRADGAGRDLDDDAAGRVGDGDER